MKKIIIIMYMLLCMFSGVYASEVSGEIATVQNESGDLVDNKEVMLITPDTYTFKTLKGEVIEVGEPYDQGDETKERCQDLKVYINDKGHKATALITYKMSFYEDTINYAKPFSVGDKVYVYTTFENGRMIGTEIAYRDNSSYLILIIILFVLSVIIIGGLKGVKSILSLAFTIIAIFYILIPGIMAGKNPLFLTIVVSIIIIFITFLIISGFNKKSFSAMIGTTAGIVVSGLFAILFGNLMSMTGMCEQTGLLAGISEAAKSFDFKGILFSGIIIGSLRRLYGCWNVTCISTL